MDAKQQGLDSELESFRAKWLSDLRTKRDGQGEASRQPESSGASSSRPARKEKELPISSSLKKALPVDDDGEHFQSPSFDAPPLQTEGSSIDPTVQGAKEKPVSALDHYEAAMEKEAQGNMGESLKLYRIAYKVSINWFLLIHNLELI
jgi:F-box protein 9